MVIINYLLLKTPTNGGANMNEEPLRPHASDPLHNCGNANSERLFSALRIGLYNALCHM